MLGHPKVRQALKIDDRLLKKISTKAKEENEKLAKQIKELKKQAREEVLSLLTDEQREKLKDLVGDDFKFQEPVVQQRQAQRDDD